MIAGQQAMNSGMIVILTYGGNRQVVFVGAITSHMATACSESKSCHTCGNEQVLNRRGICHTYGGEQVVVRGNDIHTNTDEQVAV